MFSDYEHAGCSVWAARLLSANVVTRFSVLTRAERCSICQSFLKGPFPPCRFVCVDVCVLTLLHSSSQRFLSLSLTFPSVFHISFFSTRSPSPTSALYFFSLFSSLLSSSPLLGPYPAPSLQYVFPDEWGHWLAASTGASRAQVLRAQSVKWHWSPLQCYSVSSAFLQSVLCETWSFSKDTLLPIVGQAAYSPIRIFFFWAENLTLYMALGEISNFKPRGIFQNLFLLLWLFTTFHFYVANQRLEHLPATVSMSLVQFFIKLYER